ncbi:MAG TPA: hypothetical protein VJQ06_12870 [Rhizomicrobium sp.]|nr:hypothetical protein [Rhizomicrobium sp.]
MNSLSRRVVLSLPFVATLLAKTGAGAQTPRSSVPDFEWHSYAVDNANTRYAPLDQINASNFNDLEVAWRFKPDMMGARPEYKYESTPLMIKGRLYNTAGSRRAVVCLDATNGELLWMHSENEGERGINAPRQFSGRGVSYWTDGKNDERIIYVTPGYRMIALDARTGIPVKGFGVNGVVDLKLNDDQDIDLITGDVGLNATPLVIKDTVVVGAAHSSGRVPRSQRNVKGYVRGFDARTGKRKWIFHTIPRKGEFGYDSWVVPGQSEIAGNSGVWAQMSADEKLGLVYLPVELATGDYNGQYRAGPALFGESLVAVDVQTGKRKWHYQFVHHGVWDFDLPCAPILCDVPIDGKVVKVLAQPSKQAFLYVLNRETGEPIWPIVEKPVPKGDVPGEWYSPTQPFPTKPPAYSRQGVSVDDLIDFTPALRAQALELIKNYTIGPMFMPPTVGKVGGNRGTLHAPSLTGGTDWAGGAYDPENHYVYVFASASVAILAAVPNPTKEVSDFDYVSGTPGQPIRAQVPEGSAAAAGGAGRGAAGRGAAAAAAAVGGDEGGGGTTVQGLPLLKPPYGTITAIDLKTGTFAWQIAHGETPDNVKNHPLLRGLNIPRTGRGGLVGPLCTKTLVICPEGGFVITPNGARGAMVRAYDKKTGKEVGAIYAPAPSAGAPMTYMLKGEQYLVVAVGGGNYSDELIAYRLPRA